MRRFLDRLYLVCGWLAAISMVLLTVLVVAQIVGRVVNVVVPSVIQISGFLLAATIFFGLAYTMAAGDHIRVTILFEMVGRRVRFWLESWCLVAGLVITVYFGVFSIQFTWESFVFGDKADGLVAIPLWLPQLPMVIGTLSLAVRLVDELVILIRTGEPVHLKSGEEQYVEEILKAEIDSDHVRQDR